MQMVRWEYEENKNLSDALKTKINKLKQKDEGVAAGLQSLSQISNLEQQRETSRSLRGFWFQKHIDYMQKINDISNPLEAEKAEDYCATKSEWVLKENEAKWVDCFKKSSNLDSKIKDKECEKVPFMSDSLLKLIHQKGNIRCSLRYLDYLTIKCNVKERRLHTELGCLYVQYITRLLNKYKLDTVKEAPKEEDPKEYPPQPEDKNKEESDEP